MCTLTKKNGESAICLLSPARLKTTPFRVTASPPVVAILSRSHVTSLDCGARDVMFHRVSQNHVGSIKLLNNCGFILLLLSLRFNRVDWLC